MTDTSDLIREIAEDLMEYEDIDNVRAYMRAAGMVQEIKQYEQECETVVFTITRGGKNEWTCV